MRALLVLALFASTARADEYRDGDKALVLASGVTIVGGVIAMPLVFMDESPARNALLAGAGTAFVVGPSIGHLYAGELWNKGLGLRAAGLATIAASVAWDDAEAGRSNLDDVLYWAGAVTYGLGMYVEIMSIKPHVDAMNDERALHASSQLWLVPAGRGVALRGFW